MFRSTFLTALLLWNASCADPTTGGSTSTPPPAEQTPATQPVNQPYTQKIPGTDLSFKMTSIPGGTFVMGSPQKEKHRKPDEGPQIEVSVEPFYIGKYEVTWDLFQEFTEQYDVLGRRRHVEVPHAKLADAVSYPTPIYDVEAGPALQRMGGRNAGYPAVSMSDFAAKQFTKWLSAKTGRFYRLPTEAEWEYAARAGSTTAFHFGDDGKQLGDYGWYYDNAEKPDGEVGYHKVGLKKPNPFGLYDMHGNVAEIVIDQYDPAAYGPFQSKVHDWRQVVRWPDQQYPRVTRGGHYDSDAEDCRSAARQQLTIRVNQQDPCIPKSPWWWTEGFGIGFRVVSPLRTPPKAEQHRFWDADNDKLREILQRDREIRQMMEEVQPKTGAASTNPA